MAKRMIDFWLLGNAAVTAMHEQSPSRWWRVKYLDFPKFGTAFCLKIQVSYMQVNGQQAACSNPIIGPIIF